MKCSIPHCKSEAREGFKRCERCAARARFDIKKAYDKDPEKFRNRAINYYQANRRKLVSEARKYRAEHPDVMKSVGARFRARHHERLINRERSRRAEVRTRLLAIFGSKCCICGFTDPRALQIDHVAGGGAEELRRLGSRQYTMKYVELVTEGHKLGAYQLLCANCNWIKRFENKEFGYKLS